MGHAGNSNLPNWKTSKCFHYNSPCVKPTATGTWGDRTASYCKLAAPKNQGCDVLPLQVDGMLLQVSSCGATAKCPPVLFKYLRVVSVLFTLARAAGFALIAHICP